MAAGDSGVYTTILDYVSFQILSNAATFGNITSARSFHAGVSNNTRGVFGGGFNGSIRLASMEYITIATTGNAAPFGNLTVARNGVGACSDSHGGLVPIPPLPSGIGRGVFGGGYDSSNWYNTIDYIHIASTANAAPFGNLTVARLNRGGAASSVRGIFAGGTGEGAADDIEYITIATESNGSVFGKLSAAGVALTGTSNSIIGIFVDSFTAIKYILIAAFSNAVNFGNLSLLRTGTGALSSSTRGVFAGGELYSPAGTASNRIDYVLFASTGNTTTFGNLTVARQLLTGISSSVRGIFAGGYGSAGSGLYYDTMDYITIATTGNAADFGDLTIVRSSLAGCSNSTRGVFAGGVDSSVYYNTIEYITLAATPPVVATDFGDLTVSRGALTGISDSHGGL
jgi:hypothetical protein